MSPPVPMPGSSGPARDPDRAGGQTGHAGSRGLQPADAGPAGQAVEGANARNDAQAAGVAEDILALADVRAKAFNDAVKLNNDIAGAYRELERYQKRIQGLIKTFGERCSTAETHQEEGPLPTLGTPQGESWQETAKNVLDEDTGQPLDGATLTLIPKGGGNRTPTHIDRSTPRPGDTVVASAPCHEREAFRGGRRLSPEPDPN